MKKKQLFWNFQMVLQSSTSNTVINIWEYFKELSELIGTSEFSD